MIDVREKIKRQLARRPHNPGRIGLKINLYHDFEVEAVVRAADAAGVAANQIECMMVGDSYLTTHLARSSTRLEPGEHEWARGLMASLVSECRAAIDRTLPTSEAPYLLADMPDGAAASPDSAIRSARSFLDAGAEAVKLEVASEYDFVTLEGVCDAGIPAVVHLGYTPQQGPLRRYGATIDEFCGLCDDVRRARACGAVAIVLEMVTETANRLLCRPHPGGLAVYSIFSGRAELGAQSLNVWDSVFQRRASKYFPPTATLDVARDRDRYGPETIVPAMRELMRMTVDRRFPLTPEGRDLPAVLIDPWGEDLPRSNAA